MQPPNGANAVVSRAKLTDYLLSSTHPDGRHKSEYLRRFGFRAESWAVLQEALLRHAADGEVVDEGRSEFGIRYLVEGPLRAPDGRNPIHRTVWIIEAGSTMPRLITAYPTRRRSA